MEKRKEIQASKNLKKKKKKLVKISEDGCEVDI